MVPEKAHGVGDASRILYIKYVVSCQQGADSFYRCADAADDPYAIQKNVVVFFFNLYDWRQYPDFLEHRKQDQNYDTSCSMFLVV